MLEWLETMHFGMPGGEIMEEGNSVDQLEIEVEASSAEAEQKIDALRQALERLKKTTTGFGDVGDKIRDMGTAADRSYPAVKAKKQKEIDAPVSSGKEIVESESSLEKKAGILERIKSILESMKPKPITDTDKFIKATKDIDVLQSKADTLKNRIQDALNAGDRGKATELAGQYKNIARQMDEIKPDHSAWDRFSSAVQSAGGALKKIAAISIAPLKKGFEVVMGTAKKLASALGELVKKGINKAVAGMKSLAASFGRKLTSPIRGAIAAYNKWKDAIFRVAFYRAVRAAIKAVTDAIKTGTDNLYQYSKLIGTSFAPAMDKLATSALYLKNSIGAMFAPLIEAVAPIIDALVDKLVDLINMVGKAFAAMTGKDVYSQARKHAVEYAESAEDATKKTKELKKFLLGIDELNIMPKQDEDDSGKKNALEDYASMFEEVEVPIEDNPILEAIKDGDWGELGKLLAEKLNDLLDKWDAYGWGKKLGELINKALEFAYNFLKTFDFFKLGKKIAEFFNGLFDTVNWDLLGRTFAAGLNGLFNFIYGFATTLNWKKVGLSISQAINGFWDELDAVRAAQAVSALFVGIFDAINTALTSINWGLIGKRLSEFLNNVDWYGAVYGALMVIVNALDAVKATIDSFFRNWDWQSMATQIYTAINHAVSNVDWAGIGRTLGDMLVTVFQFGFALLAGIDWGQLAQGVLDGITTFIDEIGERLNITAFTDMILDVINTVADAVKGIIQTTSEWVGSLDLEPIKESFGKLLEAVNPLVDTIVSGLSWAWDNVLLPLAGWFIEDAAPAGIDLLTAAMNALNDVLLVLEPVFKDLWDNILKPMATFIGSTFVAAINALASALNGIASLLQSFIDSVKSAANAVTSFFKGTDSAAAKAGKSFPTMNTARMASMDFATPKAYASGGFPGSGEMFIAREAGPELVGRIGQKTSVANNEQIVTGISDGVKDANTDVVNALYAIGSMIVRAVEENSGDVTLDGESLVRRIQPYQERLSSLQGVSLVN